MATETSSIPKNLSECTKFDPTANCLNSWANRLERWGEVLFVFLVISGAIISLILGLNAADNAFHDDEFIAFMGAFFSSVLSWGLYAFVEYCAYHAIALLISALARIVQNTSVTSNVALYSAYQEYKSCETSVEDSIPSTPAPFIRPEIPKSKTEVWHCPFCGQRNSTDSQFCKGCGKYK